TIAEPDDDANEPNVMVFFGSGQYLVESDLVVADDATDNYFYGVWDKSDSTVSSSDLVEQTISTETYSYTDTNDKAVDVEYRLLTKNSVDYASKDGWKIALNPDGGDTGERIITNPVVRGDVVYFNSSVPTANDPCSSGGYGYRFGVDLATGGEPNEPVFDTNHDGIVNEYDEPAGGKEIDILPSDPTLTENESVQGSPDGSTPPIEDLQDLSSPETGRFSWQELLQ
ncbi:MAG: hypothetical protein GY820_13480, partial [Gammaproteobacteria bacterium]|nr:hypothetical protein [Gammaproteobacteria bacterium]